MWTYRLAKGVLITGVVLVAVQGRYTQGRAAVWG